jgi:hypothetical protein
MSEPMMASSSFSWSSTGICSKEFSSRRGYIRVWGYGLRVVGCGLQILVEVARRATSPGEK